jgi:HEAT repeat protein
MLRSLFAFASLAVLALATLPAATAQEKSDDDPVIDGKKASVWVEIIEKDESARKRALAVDALTKFWIEKHSDQAIFSIGRALRVDPSAAVRVQAAMAPGGIREVEIRYLIEKKQSLGVKDLVDSMGNEKESRVKKEVAKAIGRFPAVAKMAVAQLTGALKDTDAATRAAVAEAIAVAGSDAKSAAVGLAPLLSDEDKAVKRAVVIALGRISPEGAATIADTMAKMLATEKEADLRIELVTSIGLLGEKSPAVIAALTGLLTESDDALRRRATRTLGTFGPSANSAADELFKVAKSDKQKDIRVDAVRGFGSVLGPAGVKERVKDFLSLLVDPEYEVRLAVVEEIGALGNDLMQDRETIKALRVRLSDPHPKVRDAVMTALNKIEKKPEPKKEP